VAKVLTAAARRITGKGLKLRNKTPMGGDTEAWHYYSTMGEVHYLSNTVANSMGMVELYIAKRTEDGWQRVEDKNDPAVVALDALGGDSPTGMSNMQTRFGLNLFVTGDSYLIGHPHEDEMEVDPALGMPILRTGPDLASLCWKVYSAFEVKFDAGKVKIRGAEHLEDDCVVIRVWREHPMDGNFADSPIRSALHLLRRLEALEKYDAALMDSRFVGAGIVWMPQGALAVSAGALEDDEDGDSFLDTVIKVAGIAIKDRDSAESMVPIFATLPDDVPWRPELMSWASPLDSMTKDLTDEAIRRLALSLDAPPEILLGQAGGNHWSSWQIAEDFVKTHILPTVGIIRDALVREYLRPILEANGVANPEDYTIEADASALTLRPNRSTEALSLNAAGLISDASTREAMGFGEEDAPEAKAIDEAVERALDLVKNAPSLAQDPGMPELVNQIRLVLGLPTVDYGPEGEPAVEESAPVEVVEPEPEPDAEVEPGPPQTEIPGEAA
jgi:hypothetical protein